MFVELLRGHLHFELGGFFFVDVLWVDVGVFLVIVECFRISLQPVVVPPAVVPVVERLEGSAVCRVSWRVPVFPEFLPFLRWVVGVVVVVWHRYECRVFPVLGKVTRWH